MPSTGHTSSPSLSIPGMPASPPPGTRPHLSQLDFVRALTVLGVITVHATFFTNSDHSAGAALVVMSLHYTREVFLFLTGFVLFYRYSARSIAWFEFWRRRLMLIVIPYILWTLIYGYVGIHPGWAQFWPFVRRISMDLVQGQAWYHLYYLLITVQVYLVFPGLRWLVDRSRTRHLWLLATSVAFEVGLMVWFQSGLPSRGWLGAVLSYRSLIFLTYQLYLLAGALAAVHLSSFDRWIHDHAKTVTTIWLVTFAATVATFVYHRMDQHLPTIAASSVFQPVMVPYCLATILLLYRWGRIWTRAPRSGWLARAIHGLAHHSFGIYLLHPLVLYLIVRHLPQWLDPTWPVVHTVVIAGLTLAGSYVAVSLVALTPASSCLFGLKPDVTARGSWATVRSRIFLGYFRGGE